MFGEKGEAERKPRAVETGEPTSPARAPAQIRTVAESARASTTVSDSIHEQILMKIEPGVAVQLNRDELSSRVHQMVARIASDQRVPLNQQEQDTLAIQI